MTLNQTLPNWADGDGVFTQLNNLTTTPWGNSVSSFGLDIAYHGQRSGDKFVAPMVYNWLDDNAELTDDGILKIVSGISSRYYQKWNHLWDVYISEYNPLNTYNLTETIVESGQHTENGTDTRTPNLTTEDVIDQESTNSTTRTPNLKTEKESVGEVKSESIRTPNLTTTDILDQDDTDSHTTSGSFVHGETITTNGSNNSTVNNSVYGFNSTDAAPASVQSTQSTNSSTDVHSGTDTNQSSTSGTNTRDSTTTRTETGTDKSESTGSSESTGTTTETGTDKTEGNGTLEGKNTRKETGTDTTQKLSSGTNSSNITRTREGNMYRSPSELLSFDRDFWLTDYFSIVFADVDEFLTLAIYSSSPVNQTVF